MRLSASDFPGGIHRLGQLSNPDLIRRFRPQHEFWGLIVPSVSDGALLSEILQREEPERTAGLLLACPMASHGLPVALRRHGLDGPALDFAVGGKSI